MLPITNHRGFHVPHSLATAAAIVALVTALSWDFSDSEANALSDAGALEPVATATSQVAESQDRPPAPARAGGTKCEPGALSGLLPLVLPSISGF